MNSSLQITDVLGIIKKIQLRVETLCLGFVLAVIATSNIFIPIIAVSLFVHKLLGMISLLWVSFVLFISISFAFAPWGLYNDLRYSRSFAYKCFNKIIRLINPIAVYAALLHKAVTIFKKHCDSKN